MRCLSVEVHEKGQFHLKNFRKLGMPKLEMVFWWEDSTGNQLAVQKNRVCLQRIYRSLPSKGRHTSLFEERMDCRENQLEYLALFLRQHFHHFLKLEELRCSNLVHKCLNT